MPCTDRHPDVKMISVVQFVEELSALFDLGTEQAEKLSVPNTFSKKQDRYALLDGDNAGTLITALVGISVFPGSEPSEATRKMVRAFVGYAQQLVSWISASLVHQAIDQEELNTAIIELFGTAQLAALVSCLNESDMLEDYSPLKQLFVCVEELIRQDFDPIKACKELMRSRIKKVLSGREPVGLAFFKHMNSLDSRSSTGPSVQRRELKTLSDELATVLRDQDTHSLIDELTGIYSAMMALKQLYRRMDKEQPQYFPAMLRSLHQSMTRVSQCSVPPQLSANRDLFMSMLDKNNSWIRRATPSNTPPFRRLLENHRTFSSVGLPNLLRYFLRDGLTATCSRNKLRKVNKQLQRCVDKPFYNGVQAFVLGALAISEQDMNARAQFDLCLRAAEYWPLGPFRSQATRFAIGLTLAQEPSQPPNALNPLVSAYIDSLPQITTIRLDDGSTAPESTEKIILHDAITQHNAACWELIGGPSTFLVNPFSKIEAYLQKIFDGLSPERLPTAEHLASVTRDVTRKRDVERVKSDIFGTGLHEWLTQECLTEVWCVFPDLSMWDTVPAIRRYLDFPVPLRTAIANVSKPA